MEESTKETSENGGEIKRDEGEMLNDIFHNVCLPPQLHSDALLDCIGRR